MQGNQLRTNYPLINSSQASGGVQSVEDKRFYELKSCVVQLQDWCGKLHSVVASKQDQIIRLNQAIVSLVDRADEMQNLLDKQSVQLESLQNELFEIQKVKQ